MSKKYFYSKINNAQELKELHDEAALHGKLEVGLSRGKILYAWDEERHNIRSIRPEEAAERLGLTLRQIDEIIATDAKVVFEEPELIEDIEVVIDEPRTQEEINIIAEEPGEGVEEEAPADHLEKETVQEEGTGLVAAPHPAYEEDDTDEELTEQREYLVKLSEALIKLAGKVIDALEEFKSEI